MSDDTRQARIAAAMIAISERSDCMNVPIRWAITKDYEFANDPEHVRAVEKFRKAVAAGLDAADAIGRERVSVPRELFDEVYHLLDDFVSGVERGVLRRLDALLTAQPEPGTKTKWSDKPLNAWSVQNEASRSYIYRDDYQQPEPGTHGVCTTCNGTGWIPEDEFFDKACPDCTHDAGQATEGEE